MNSMPRSIFNRMTRTTQKIAKRQEFMNSAFGRLINGGIPVEEEEKLNKLYAKEGRRRKFEYEQALWLNY